MTLGSTVISIFLNVARISELRIADCKWMSEQCFSDLLCCEQAVFWPT